MSWYGNELGRLVRKPEFESSPSLKTVCKDLSDSWLSIDLLDIPILPTNMNQNEKNLVRSLKDHLHPTRTTILLCILLPSNASRLDFKPGMI